MPRRCLLAVLSAAVAVCAALPPAASASGGAVVISQFSPEQSEPRPSYVSVMNRSSQTVNPGGMSVQWRGPGGSWQSVATLPSFDLPPGRSYLIARGDPRTDPAPSYADQLSLGLFIGVEGTLALVQGDVLLGCSTSADCAADTRISDLVGYGNAAIAEGTPVVAQAAKSPGGIGRRLSGCLDTDNNAADVESTGALSPITYQSGIVIGCEGNQTAGPTASGGSGRLNVASGKQGVRNVSGTDPDDRVVDFAVSLAPNGAASIANVAVSPGAGAPGSAQVVIPADAAPGTYTATVTVSSGGGGLQKATCTFPITVATGAAAAGTTTRCTVPNLKNLTLAKAKARLKAKGCATGKVKKPKGVKKGLVVRKQSRKSGAKLKRGTKVNLTLGKKPKKKK